MKIIREPMVHLVGWQCMDPDAFGRFLQDHGITWEPDAASDVETLVETAGRLCYMSFSRPRPGGNKAYLAHILESSHGSVLEHAVWNFIFTGISRSLSHELVRHRAGVGISQMSQRYVDESVAEYVIPDVIDKDPFLREQWLKAVARCHDTYVYLVEVLMRQLPDDLKGTDRRKVARQAARSVLPNATETKVFWTANARAIRHCIEQRCSRHAEPEIRKLFNRVLDIMQKESPAIFGDYQRLAIGDGTFEAVTEHRKV